MVLKLNLTTEKKVLKYLSNHVGYIRFSIVLKTINFSLLCNLMYSFFFFVSRKMITNGKALLELY